MATAFFTRPACPRLPSLAFCASTGRQQAKPTWNAKRSEIPPNVWNSRLRARRPPSPRRGLSADGWDSRQDWPLPSGRKASEPTRDRMPARYVNAMCDAPALLHADKKQLSGGGRPDGAFCVHTDAERAHPHKVGENLSMQQCSVAV